MNKEMSFVIFCLENYKVYRSLTGKQAVALFDKYGVFDCLLEGYDVLYTTGYQYMNRDIDEYLKARNAAFPS